MQSDYTSARCGGRRARAEGEESTDSDGRGGAEGGWLEEGRTTEGGRREAEGREARGGGWGRQEEGEDDGEVA